MDKEKELDYRENLEDYSDDELMEFTNLLPKNIHWVEFLITYFHNEKGYRVSHCAFRLDKVDYDEAFKITVKKAFENKLDNEKVEGIALLK